MPCSGNPLPDISSRTASESFDRNESPTAIACGNLSPPTPELSSQSPHESQTVTEDKEEESGKEEEDCAWTVALPNRRRRSESLLSAPFLNGVRMIVMHLLNNVIHEYWKEICYGCQINHPSQKHHKCLLEIPECFYECHFDQLMKRHRSVYNDCSALFVL